MFDNIPGGGKAVDPDDDHLFPESLRRAYRILKNSNCLPRELELRSRIHNMQTLLNMVEDPQGKDNINRKLALLILSLNLASPDRLDPRGDRDYIDRIRCRTSGLD